MATYDKQGRYWEAISLDASIQKFDPQLNFSGWHPGLLGKTQVENNDMENLAGLQAGYGFIIGKSEGRKNRREWEASNLF
jgi:hypothetical protein